MPAPIDIASRPQTGQPKSNLTSQLRAAGRDGIMMPNESLGGRSGSISQSNGIPMANNARLRRESMVSNDLARSLMGGGGGMSWGGVSVGSWIRDDIMMTGTSPFTFQSPSYHSSSYLPKLEAEFCRDFSCCGIPLPTLHDLLRHYEELHAQQLPLANDGEIRRDSHDMNRPQSRHHQQQNNDLTAIGGIPFEMMRQQQIQRQRQHHEDGRNQDDHQDGEIAGDMEMDDDMTPPPNNTTPLTPQNLTSQRTHTPTSTLGHPSYHNTPNPPNRQLPQLIGQQPTHFSPESSVPGTPLATDQLDYGFPQGLAGYQNQGLPSFGGLPFGNVDGNGGMALDMCIDEPAKRLFSPGGQAMGGYSQSQIQQLMSNGSSAELARRLRDDCGMASHATDLQGGMLQEDKPFKCPVIGCEKAYKNQNGLKYHKSHGHTNQQLHDNSDGTFSIVNPETSAPYPGTLGMEKEKPYRCEFCGKRYKNLNGLKYHRNHSSHPTGPSTLPMGGQQPVPGGVVAVAGGLAETGIGLA